MNTAMDVTVENYSITVTLHAPSNLFTANRSWVGLYVAMRQMHKNYMDYKTVKTATDVVTFSGLKDGWYDLRYFSDSYDLAVGADGR